MFIASIFLYAVKCSAFAMTHALNCSFIKIIRIFNYVLLFATLNNMLSQRVNVFALMCSMDVVDFSFENNIPLNIVT